MMAGAQCSRHVRATGAVPRPLTLPADRRRLTRTTRELIDLGGIAVTAVRPSRETGTPLLFVHGLFAAGWMFEWWSTYFAERGRAAYAVDLRGHGASGRVPALGRVSLADYIDDALRAARQLGDVIIVGHSMGSLIAQKIAEMGAATAAVLVCPAPPRGIPLISLELVMREAKYLPAMLRSREIRVRRADADAMILNRVPQGERASMFARLQPDSGRAGRDIMLGALAIDAGKVRCPVLVLAGVDDRFVPFRVARRVAAKYNAPLRRLEGCAHVMMQEPRWSDAAGEIARWLAIVEPVSP
jgi:pimeloyl-ACP methyl ester carboxylesterase